MIILNMSTIYDNHMMYDSGDMEHNRQIFFSHFGPFFALLHPPLLPPNNPENQKSEKMKKTPGDIIILHKCTKYHDHMRYFPQIRHLTDVIIIFHFGLFFALCHLTAQKIQISKKSKKLLEIK